MSLTSYLFPVLRIAADAPYCSNSICERSSAGLQFYFSDDERRAITYEQALPEICFADQMFLTLIKNGRYGSDFPLRIVPAENYCDLGLNA